MQRVPFAEPYLDPPEEKPMPLCPVCGEECEEVYVDVDSRVAGCDRCMTVYISWDYFDEE